MTRLFNARDIQAALALDLPPPPPDGKLASSPALSIEERFDLDQGLLQLEVRNHGTQEAVFHLYDGLVPSPSAHRYRLRGERSLSLSWPADLYDLHFLAPDGLYRRFAGRLKADGATSATLIPARRGVGLILGLTSPDTVWFCVIDESGRRTARRSRVLAGDRPHLRVPVTSDGWYDVSVSRVGGDFRRRFAGRVPV
ncbi:DUF756 domain-containing protein [Pseudomonas sp. ODNR1LW]|nr:DUF756 domain-containing protein [Pseudomonas sp. ODNR1LW]